VAADVGVGVGGAEEGGVDVEKRTKNGFLSPNWAAW